MYVYECVCVCACARVCVYGCVYMFVCICMYVAICMYVCMYVCVCVGICLYVCVCVCMFVMRDHAFGMSRNINSILAATVHEKVLQRRPENCSLPHCFFHIS
jgi:hypothetical protein